MAGIKNSLSKGLTTLNLKTSNFMEENKLKTHISTLESEIEKLKFSLGESIYKNWKEDTFSIQTMEPALNSIKEKYAMIETIKVQIEELETKEKQILGSEEAAKNTAARGMFCPNCGAPCKVGYKFCEKCGGKLE